MAAFSVVWSYFFFPELKVSYFPVLLGSETHTDTISQGRSLEEVDELFEARLSARKFKNFESFGAARMITTLENEGTLEGKTQFVKVGEA